jgi:hexosaminidase
LLISFPSEAAGGDTIALIPKPVKSSFYEQEKFTINEKTVLIARGKSSRSDAEIFNEYFTRFYGISLKIRKATWFRKNIIRLKRSSWGIMPDGYKMSVRENEITITGDESGIFYGLQTLRQLLPPDNAQGIIVPACEIEDYPRYTWRGMHLDVCRHFFPKEFIKKYIDDIALYKMNTFHWHLTEDQGWRIEIKKYPGLTGTGSWRNGTLIGAYSSMPHIFDTIKYGGFYSQDDIREIVEYAKKRHVTIVPEIEMPGHSLAALASYPELSCTGGPFAVANLWGVFEDVYCPKETTFTFLENVLSEVIGLFPSQYIHIGGDEVPKYRWKNCKDCQELIRREGLKDENELQSYFIKRIEKYINSKGRKLIGWDEILEGGIAPNATIMSWRGTEGGIAAARQNHDVVMTPGSYCYFDHYQGNPRYEPLAIGGYTTVEKVYSFNPIPAGLTPEQQKHILGAQGNVWTEYIDSPKKVEYMIFPRICALSEVLWSPPGNSNYVDFKMRLIKHFAFLGKAGINYSQAIYELNLNSVPSEQGYGIAAKITTSAGLQEIFYTTDGTEPTVNSSLYTGQLNINETTRLKAAYFEGGRQKGNTIEQSFFVNKATGRSVSLAYQPDERYSTGGSFTLVDGIVGIIPWYGKEWLGFNGKNMEAVIDLGSVQSFTKVTVDVLNAEYSWIYLPKRIGVYVSFDGTNYTSIKNIEHDEIVRMNRAVIVESTAIQARYVKIIAENIGKIPSGKPGEGNDSWLFVDEISVE